MSTHLTPQEQAELVAHLAWVPVATAAGREARQRGISLDQAPTDKTREFWFIGWYEADHDLTNQPAKRRSA